MSLSASPSTLQQERVNISSSSSSSSSTTTTAEWVPLSSSQLPIGAKSTSPTSAESITSALILPSPPSSPNLSPVHSSAMPSPSLTDSAGGISESSDLPSVSSSFFFSSSAPASPPGGRSRTSSEHHDNSSLQESHKSHHHLIIPSLTLPSALRRPTPFGQTLGSLRLLVLGAQGAGKSFLTGLLLEDNEDVVEVGTWEDWEPGLWSDDVNDDGSFSYGKVLRASTDWIEKRDAFGAERYEPTGNVHIVELPGYSQDADVTELISRLKHIIEGPFRALHNVLHPETAPSAIIASLLASPTSPLYTAMVCLLPSSPTPLDLQIISALSTHIPLIVLPRLHGPHRHSSSSSSSSSSSPNETFLPPKLSAFRPASAVVLRNGLFHSPETVALLRSEAADRFLKWREVERSVEGIMSTRGDVNDNGMKIKKRRSGRTNVDGSESEDNAPAALTSTLRGIDEPPLAQVAAGVVQEVEEGWSKARWEAEWLESLSKDVDEVRRMRMREMTITQKDFPRAAASEMLEHPPPSYTGGGGAAIFDPLHLPSLIAFSFSLLDPLRTRLEESVREICMALHESRLRIALLSGFCLGFGVGAGLFVRRS